MNPISKQIHIGTVGELLVTIRLLQYGVQAAPPIKDSGNDLIAVRGEIFRAIQVKTTESPKFSLYRLRNRLFHIAALVHLVGDDNCIWLDQSQVFLLDKTTIDRNIYRIDELEGHAMSQDLVDRLFAVSPVPEAQPARPMRAAAQQIVGPERG